MTKLEAFIYGATLPETLEKIEAHERGVREAAERVEREKVEREERSKRERDEREERYRREREERERAQEARLSGSRRYEPAPVGTPAPSAVSSVPVSRFRRTDAPVPRSPLVVDPAAAHVPEPARMVSFPDPADPAKQMIVGRSIVPEDYDPNHPDAVQFMRSTPEELPDRQRYYRGKYYDGDPRY